jgi:hypothetical protein
MFEKPYSNATMKKAQIYGFLVMVTEQLIIFLHDKATARRLLVVETYLANTVTALGHLTYFLDLSPPGLLCFRYK